ncbi:MAG: hypothetical protein ABL958_12860 [Bdellovibrionia bacterium]
MKLWIVLILISIMATSAQAGVVSFKVWKAQKIQQAQSTLKIAKKNSVTSAASGARLKQAKTNMVIAQELSPNDYFILYLAPKYQGNAKALEVAARFMSRQELAEILVGYSNHLQTREEGPRPSFPPVLTR